METTKNQPYATLQHQGSPPFSIGAGTIDEAIEAAHREANESGLATVLDYGVGNQRVSLLVIDPLIPK